MSTFRQLLFFILLAGITFQCFAQQSTIEVQTDISCGSDSLVIRLHSPTNTDYSIEYANLPDGNWSPLDITLRGDSTWLITFDSVTLFKLRAVALTDTSNNIEFNWTSQLSLDLNITPPNCQQDNGSVELIVTGGRGTYEYSFDNSSFSTNNHFSGLGAGNYAIAVRDTSQCELIDTIDLKKIDMLREIAAFRNQTCGDSNGIITLNTYDGFPPYEYRLNDGPYQPNNTFDSLIAGTYTYRIKDSLGCAITNELTIEHFPAPVISDVSNINPSCGSTGSIEVSTQGGTPPINYSINPIRFQQTGYFGNLLAGTYTVKIIDAYNCEDTVNVSLTQINELNIDDTTLTDASNCVNADGLFEITALGTEPIKYVLNESDTSDIGIFDSLTAGNYELTVYDSCGATERIEFIIECPIDTSNTGIGDMQLTGLSIYPNPFTNSLKIIDESMEFEPVTLKIVDIKGILVKTVYEPGEELILEDLQKGIYIIQLVRREQTGYYRVVKH